MQHDPQRFARRELIGRSIALGAVAAVLRGRADAQNTTPGSTDLLITRLDIVTYDDSGTVISDGPIAIRGNSIVWVGKAGALAIRLRRGWNHFSRVGVDTKTRGRGCGYSQSRFGWRGTGDVWDGSGYSNPHLRNIGFSAQWKNLFIVASALGFGMIPTLSLSLFQHLPSWMSPITNSSLILGTLVAVVLNLVFNGFWHSAF